MINTNKTKKIHSSYDTLAAVLKQFDGYKLCNFIACLFTELFLLMFCSFVGLQASLNLPGKEVFWLKSFNDPNY